MAPKRHFERWYTNETWVAVSFKSQQGLKRSASLSISPLDVDFVGSKPLRDGAVIERCAETAFVGE